MIYKRKVLWLALLLLLTTVLTACALIEHLIAEEFEPTFLELEYTYSFEVDYFPRARLVEGEFTWFDTFGSCGRPLTFDELNTGMRRQHSLELPEYIDVDENSFIAISFGRRLQMLYYFEAHRRDTTTEQVIARPVFEREHYPNTAFVYRVTPLPKYSFIDQRDYTDDFSQFHRFNNIPFEVWLYDRSLQAGTVASRGGRILGSTLGEGWNELAEPLQGYIHVQETHLRGMPTNHSRVISRLTRGAEFSIIGYVESGMEIDGSARWYYVRTTMASSNQLGYIHSSFVTVTSSAGS